jgi:hypothetical protein
MIVTMHQPNYLPWIGFFSKVMHSDCLVLTDTLPYTKHSVTRRNKIRTNEGWGYLTVPINKRFHGSSICDVTLPVDKSWQWHHWQTIKHDYTKADSFCHYENFFENLYQKDFEYLWQINEEIILFLLKCFEINVKVFKSSELNVAQELEETDLMIAWLKSVGADIYLSGPSGRDYLEFEKFPQNNISLRFFKFQPPVYKQRYPGFEPNMAAIDLLFNMGAQASEIIKASGSIED